MIFASAPPALTRYLPPPAWWARLHAPFEARPQHVTLHARKDLQSVWAKDHEGTRSIAPPYAFRAYTKGGVTRVFVDDTETPASIRWLLLHELAHAAINRDPATARVLRATQRPPAYAVSDAAHARVPEEQVCNAVADLLAHDMDTRPGLDRAWWRARVQTRQSRRHARGRVGRARG